MENLLKNHYSHFFNKLGIDKRGLFRHSLLSKFATFPYIGSQFGRTKKILFVGLDIGCDENPGKIQSFKERRIAIEDKNVSLHNPHIAGTYFTALFFLKSSLGLEKEWNLLKKAKSCQKGLRYEKGLPKKSPLSYIALTNLHKFVSIERSHRSGGKDRKYLDKSAETELFLNEVKAIKPDIIVFQGTSFKKKKELIKDVLTVCAKVYIGPHPSWRGSRMPVKFVEQIKPVLIAE